MPNNIAKPLSIQPTMASLHGFSCCMLAAGRRTSVGLQAVSRDLGVCRPSTGIRGIITDKDKYLDLNICLWGLPQVFL